MELFLFLLAVVVSACSSLYVKCVMSKYSKVHCSAGMSGHECASEILQRNGIGYIPINLLPGEGGDHYSTTTSDVNLSHSSFYGNSITALSVAAHECGHALQHYENYPALVLRQAMVPVSNWGSQLSWVLVLIGVIFNYNQLFINLGIIAFSLVVLFTLITLPVEFDASRRALEMLSDYGITTEAETKQCRSVLIAAALTYVAATAVALLQFMRLVLRARGRSSRRH